MPVMNKNIGLIYMASAYSHPDPVMQEARFDMACEAAADLMRQGLRIFSPIAHTHPIAQYGLPKGWDFWKQYDELFLAACAGMIVLVFDGWRESKGVQAEIAIMRAAGKPIEFWAFNGGGGLVKCNPG